MRVVFGLVLVLGIGLAGFAVYLAKGRFDQYQATVAEQARKLQSNVPLEQVFVVKRSVKYGERLTKDDVEVLAWPENAIPAGAFQDLEVLFPEGGDLRTVLRVMEEDEAILASKVTEPGEDAGVSSRLAKGMRAFALRVDVSSGVSGFLRPGDLVDVYWSGSRQGREVTRLIDVKVKLLAVDQIADGDRNSPTIARTITVEASPSQVASLAQAQATGRISLSLLGAGDDTEVGGIEIGQNELLEIEEQEAVVIEEQEECFVMMRKGAERVKNLVECPS